MVRCRTGTFTNTAFWTVPGALQHDEKKASCCSAPGTRKDMRRLFPDGYLPPFYQPCRKDCLPALAGEIEEIAFGLIGNAIEHVFSAFGAGAFVRRHGVPQTREFCRGFDASGGRIEPHDVPGREDVAVNSSFDPFEFVEPQHRPRLIALDPHDP